MARAIRIKKLIVACTLVMVIVSTLAGCSVRSRDQGLPVRVLILPKFEVGELAGDFPGEAQYF